MVSQGRRSLGSGFREGCQIAESLGINAKRISQLIHRNREFIRHVAFRRFRQIPYTLQGLVEALSSAHDFVAEQGV